MKISVIIPAYQCQETIIPVINSILAQQYQNYEIIIIIDGKDSKLSKILEPFGIRIFELEKNMGPAFARNYGAKQATGEILLFIDSDMVLLEGSFTVIIESFSDPNIDVVQGMYDKYPSNPKFITNLAALKKWVDYKPDKLREVKTIGSELFAIRKTVFFEFNGFDTEYKKPTVEDYEFGYRVARKYPIMFEKDFRGRHTFPNASKMIKNYFIRANEWANLFLHKERKKFDTGATKIEAVYSGILIWTILVSLMIVGIGFSVQISFIRQNWLNLILIIIGLYLVLNITNRDYWVNFTREYSLIIAFVSVHFIYILDSISIIGGAIGILNCFMHPKTRNEA